MDKTKFDYDFYLTTFRTADAVGMTVVNSVTRELASMAFLKNSEECFSGVA